MEYLGKAYEEIGVKPGDLVSVVNKKYPGKPSVHYPHGGEILDPRNLSYINGNPDKYVYIAALPDKRPSRTSGLSPVHFIITPLDAKPATPRTISWLKEQNDAGGKDGKCVSCDTTLKEWSSGRFFCPSCEP